MNRKSKLNQTSVPVLLRKIGKAQEELCKFAISGYHETGFKGDFMTCVALLELSEAIDYYVKRNEETKAVEEPPKE